MEILKKYKLFLTPALLLVTSCGDTVTKVDYIETDTYLSTSDSTNHSQENILKISKGPDQEERALVKLPTGKRDSYENLEAVLKNPATISLIPFVLFLEILQDLLNCQGATLSESQLTSATLVFSLQSTEEVSMTGKLSLNLLSKPWWQSANWEQAHPFATSGKWSSPGGDTDSSLTPISSVHSGNTLSFDITSYFRILLSQNEPVHFGLLLQSTSALLGKVALVSSQSNASLDRPRLVSTYQCLHSTQFLNAAFERLFNPPNPFTYYLGNH
jgi:hypothetical protein